MELITPGIITELVTGGIVYGEFFRGLDGKIYLSQNQVQGSDDNAWLYQFAEDISTTSYTQNSLPLYSSSNSSMLEGGFPSQVVKCYGSETSTNNTYSRKLGYKRYELSDHLGNVRVVITDKRFLEDENNDNLYDQTDILHADIVMANDYYPFGMISRSANATQEYRFGFNGKEKDNEWTGTEGSHLNYKYRVHDARIGRFLSIDPLTKDYPWNSPYAFSENRVIDGVELEGLEYLSVHESMIQFINGVVAWDYDNVSGGTRTKIIVQGNQIIYADHISIMRFNIPSARESDGRIEVERRKTKKSNYKLYDKRLKKRYINSKAPKSKLWIVDAIVYGAEGLVFVTQWWDKKQYERQIPFYEAAQEDFNNAVKSGYVPPALLQDKTTISNILNVILTGELSNPLSSGLFAFENEDGEYRYLTSLEYSSMLYQIGMNIYNGNLEEPFQMPEGHTREELEDVIKEEEQLFKSIEEWKRKR